MSHLYFDGVNNSFDSLVRQLHEGEIKTVVSPSRVGEIIQIPEPVTLTYYKPRQRVLFNQARDQNCYFTLYESLWMLAGRNDIAPLTYYAKAYENFVNDGKETANGAYGYRWRHAHNKPEGSRTHGEFEGLDQLDVVIKHLQDNPNSRRVVLQMWNVFDDLVKADNQFGQQSNDVACNLSALFSVRTGWLDDSNPQQAMREVMEGPPKYLDMTVFNRSNDLILGSLGANFVHFTFLQEYVANSLGIEVGHYHQVSNNVHAYTERWYPSEWLADETPNYYQEYHNQTKLVQNRSVFDHEVKLFVEANKDGAVVNNSTVWSEPFLQQVAQPMCHAFHMHKGRDYEAALSWMKLVTDDDWARAGTMWLKKRMKTWEAKQNA